jgi:cytochrome c-type biogenesis protein CcmH/NrfG
LLVFLLVVGLGLILLAARYARRRAKERPSRAPASNGRAATANGSTENQGDATAAFNLGVLLEERGDPAGAEAAYRRADQRGNEEVANLARTALLDLHADVRQPSPTSAGRSR